MSFYLQYYIKLFIYLKNILKLEQNAHFKTLHLERL